MSEDSNTHQNNSAESSVQAAAKTGKAVANIAKGAASGGVHGAAFAAAKSSKKWIIPAVALLLLPVIIVAMLPSVIFGTLFGDGTDTKSGITDDTVLTQNMMELNDGISSVLSEGLNATLSDIADDFAASGCDDYEIDNPYGSDIRFNANYFISLYCASKDTDVTSISDEDLLAIIRNNKDQLYSYTYTDEVRTVDGEIDEETGEPEQVEITVRLYTIRYNGEMHFANEVFHLSDDQKKLASNYAQNLSVFLHDGCYQVLSSTEFSGVGFSYEGVVFTDGQTQVVYYNQGDERWRDLPYGTDNIGGYACGPTAMAIVVSSLTAYTIDPPNMAQWAYENGHWCSGNGSYHTVVTGACDEWGLTVERCTREEPQRIVDALSEGKLVVAIMGPGHFTRGGHFIVLRGVTSDGKILVADPASYTRSGQEWDLSIILDEASRYALLDAPFWICGN